MPSLDKETNSYQFADTEKESIRQMIEEEARAEAPGLDQFNERRLKAMLPTQAEFDLFIHFCRARRLNPLTKDVCFQKRHGKPAYVTSIDRLRSMAEETGRYAPGRSPLFYNEKGEVQPGGVPHYVECFLKKQTADGKWHEVCDYAYFEECAQVTVSGNLDAMWAKMPHSQLAKCGDARVLRKAFPQQLGGLCIFDEMAQASHPEPGPERRAEDTRAPKRNDLVKGIIMEITHDNQLLLSKLNGRSLVRLLTGEL